MLASEIKADWLVLDEKLARKIALNLGYQVKGTLGLLLIAYRTNIISKEQVLKTVDILTKSSIRISSSLLNWFLEQL